VPLCSPALESRGAARLDLETRDGAPVAIFHICCQGAALLMRELRAIFPNDWPHELTDAPVAFGD
jgi:hypothetical protein